MTADEALEWLEQYGCDFRYISDAYQLGFFRSDRVDGKVYYVLGNSLRSCIVSAIAVQVSFCVA